MTRSWRTTASTLPEWSAASRRRFRKSHSHQSNRSMIVLFWDIDGTLLTTGRAGMFAWEDSLRELVTADFDLSNFRTAGMTDYQIARRTLELVGADTGPATVER